MFAAGALFMFAVFIVSKFFIYPRNNYINVPANVFATPHSRLRDSALATTILNNNGANIKPVASLLGHRGLKHTEKYTRAVDKLKEDAINS